MPTVCGEPVSLVEPPSLKQQPQARAKSWRSARAEVAQDRASHIRNTLIPAASAAERLQVAIGQLQNNRPEYSARLPLWAWQKGIAALVVCLIATGAVLAPGATGMAVSAALSFSFLSLAMLRAVCLWHGPLSRAASAETLAEEDLPYYTVLVPLFGEAAMVADLVAALSALDYPAAKLQILFVIEEADPAMQKALAATPMPGHFEAIVVPLGLPQTKPRALNYALQDIRGEFVVIFDAEDMPEPDQLRKAVAAFRAGPANLACVQASLNVYNANASWLTRQFTIEYTVLFDWILPALQSLGLPLPLGGTSNHFRAADLLAVGAWDPFNVTEDADLGIRLAREGYAVHVLPSTTWEEAPVHARAWRLQRKRWLKGWMQTYLVHTREPARLWRELGAWRFCGLQMLMGGLILSALVHPVFYAMAAVSAWQGTLFVPPAGGVGAAIWYLGLFNLATGYLIAIALGAAAVYRRLGPELVRDTALMPVYWLMISAAAYLALHELITAPFYWEKTAHSPRSSAAKSAGRRASP